MPLNTRGRRPAVAPSDRVSAGITAFLEARAGTVLSASGAVDPSRARKFPSSALPAAVRIDSGWNCTPSTGERRGAAAPMISSVLASTP